VERRKRKNRRKNDTQKLRRREDGMAKDKQKQIDKIASARKGLTKGTKEWNNLSNQINKLSGVSKRYDTKNALTHRQMAIAKAGRSEIVAGMKAQKTGIMDVASKVINKESDKKWKKKADTAYAKEGRKNKTRYAGD
jgi:ATPase subunit of ABC transporter with duplicated ATPase domains